MLPGALALACAGASAETWTQISTGALQPDARYAHSAIFDPGGQRMVVFGGRMYGGVHYGIVNGNDVWALSLAGPPTWTQLAPSGPFPLAREGHSAIYDPLRNRMIIFGGSRNDWMTGDFLNDVWALPLGPSPAWQELAPVGSPPRGRVLHSAVYDPVRDRMLVFGGYFYDGILGHDVFLDDTWALSLSDPPTWTQLAPAGRPPFGRSGHSAVYDPSSDRMLVFGGRMPSMNDLWALSLSPVPAWAQVNAGLPPFARAAQATCDDGGHGRMVIYAGTAGTKECGEELSDTWALPFAAAAAWAQVQTDGDSPGGRESASALCDAPRNRMVVYGGVRWDDPDPQLKCYVPDCLGDVWALSFGGPTDVWVSAPSRALAFRSVGPNPARRVTQFEYQVPPGAQARLEIFDLSGRLVKVLAGGQPAPAAGQAAWDGRNELGIRAPLGGLRGAAQRRRSERDAKDREAEVTGF